MKDIIEAAKALAIKAHEGQRYGDHPYRCHLEHVVQVLHRFGVRDEDSVAAAWLHDAVEDQGVLVSTIAAETNVHVAAIVEAVSDGPGITRHDRKMRPYHLIPKTPGAVYVKLADRIANVEMCLADEKEERCARLLTMYRNECESRVFFQIQSLEASYTEHRMWRYLNKTLLHIDFNRL